VVLSHNYLWLVGPSLSQRCVFLGATNGARCVLVSSSVSNGFQMGIVGMEHERSTAL
jgi:hypothetical protein